MVKKNLQNYGKSKSVVFGISERDHLGLIGNNPEEIELKYDKIDGVPCIVIYNAETYRKMIEKK